MNNPAFTSRGIKKKATTYEKNGEEIIFRLYHTNIVTIRPHEVILDSGGYRTMTTKRRINQILEEYDIPYKLSNIRGRWVVTGTKFDAGGYFQDGMKLTY